MNLEESKVLIEELMKANHNLGNENVAFEMEVKASKKMIQKYKRGENCIKEYEKSMNEKDNLINKFEKERKIAENMIKHLKGEVDFQVSIIVIS